MMMMMMMMMMMTMMMMMMMMMMMIRRFNNLGKSRFKRPTKALPVSVLPNKLNTKFNN
jgi:hypothetical protein